MKINKSQKLYIVLVALFLTNILTAEIIGSKLFSLEKTFGFDELNMTVLGVNNLSLTLTAGVIGWPIVFTITDIINDYYGIKAVKFMSYLSVCLIAFMFLLLSMAINVSPSPFWQSSQTKVGINDMQHAYGTVLGQGLSIIIASIIAFLVGQIIDALLFKKIKKITGDKYIWMRALMSTLLSQLIDTVVVLYIVFYIAQGFNFNLVTAWIITGYIYKFCVALLFLPLIYAIHFIVEKYLGKTEATLMRIEAIKS